MKSSGVPSDFYGVLNQDVCESPIHEVAEQVRRIGYAVLDSGLSSTASQKVSEEFDRIRAVYMRKHDQQRLRKLNEEEVIRAPMILGSKVFLDLATSPNLLAIMKLLIVGKFVLNQQNGIINPPRKSYTQGAWHRDLPYQHFVSSSPIAVNALYCVDDFNTENGSTFVLPASHKTAPFPSAAYVKRNALQLEAKAGQFVILDCMTFHCGGYNASDTERRAINHVYTIPFFKQQINLPKNLEAQGIDQSVREILGFTFQEPGSVEDYLASRETRNAE